MLCRLRQPSVTGFSVIEHGFDGLFAIKLERILAYNFRTENHTSDEL